MQMPYHLVATAVLVLLSISSVHSSSWLSPFESLAAQISQTSLRGFIPRTNLQAVQDDVVPAPNCNSLECPPYKLVHEESDFQIRRYRNATWVKTESIQDVSFNKATYRGFKSLFDYIQGENRNGSHIPMTAPVLTAIVPSAGPFCSSAFVVSLFLPAKFSESPPLPKDSQNPKLEITSTGHVCIAVRKFGGFATDFNVAEEAKALAESLVDTPWSGAVEANTAGEGYAIAQYNSPFEFSKRVNEVWVKIPVEGKEWEDCKPSKAAPSPREGGKEKETQEVSMAEGIVGVA